jgi:hypothetical protein
MRRGASRTAAYHPHRSPVSGVRCPPVRCPTRSVRSQSGRVCLPPQVVTLGPGLGGRATPPSSRGGQSGVGGGPGPGWVGRRPRVPAERPGRRAGVRSARGWRRRCGTGGGCGARWPRLPRGCRRDLGWRPRWVVVGLPPGWAGPEGPMGLLAGRACGPSAAQAGSVRSRLVADSAVTCGNGWWACQDSNLRPHPERESPV